MEIRGINDDGDIMYRVDDMIINKVCMLKDWHRI
jgi:hypothetical protein